MKKRAVSLLLCLVMLLPLVLTSCGNNNDPDDTTEPTNTYVKPATLNFYIIGDKVNEEEAAKMQALFNERAKALFKTQVEFVFCTEEEYETKVKADLEAAAAMEGKTAAEKFEESEVVTSVDELNFVEELYPEIYDNQVDILLITSRDMYSDLLGNHHLADLSDLLKTEHRDITQRVNTNLLNGAKEGSSMYGIPNNVLIGSYKYVLVNKEMAYQLQYASKKESFYTEVDRKQVLDYAALLQLARQIQACKDETDPDSELYTIRESLKSTLGVSELFPMQSTFDYPTVTFFPKENENTLLGVIYSANDTYGSVVRLDNVLANDSYRNHLALMLEAKNEGFYPTTPSLAPVDSAYGIMYLEGSYADRFAYEDDYFVFEVDQPRLEDEDPFKAMFAVSAYSASVSRSLQIISSLIADESGELRNILQYGVEGVHYTVNPVSGLLTRTQTGRTKYLMNANYTGNMVTAIPCPEDGRDASYTTYFKLQNDSATRNPLYGRTPEEQWEDTKLAMAEIKFCEAMAEAIKTDINALPETNDIFSGLSNSLIAAKRSELIAGISEDWDRSTLRDYWYYIAAGFDPTKAYDTPPTIPTSVSGAIGQRMRALYDTAESEAEAFLESAATLAEQYMDRALACETKAELDSVCAEIEALRNDKVNGKYFYADRTATWGSNNFIGVLVEEYDGETCRFSLAGALLLWWGSQVIGGR